MQEFDNLHLDIQQTIDSAQKIMVFLSVLPGQSKSRAVARALIGGGGCLFINSCYARLISFEINPNNN